MFSSIFNLYHGTPILCCTTTDLGIFWYGSRDFWSCICESPGCGADYSLLELIARTKGAFCVWGTGVLTPLCQHYTPATPHYTPDRICSFPLYNSHMTKNDSHITKTKLFLRILWAFSHLG